MRTLQHPPRFCLLLAVSILTLLGVAGCGKKEQAKPKPGPRPVDAATAITKTVPLYYDTLGKTTAFESVTIVSQVDGQIVESPFTQGSMVKKGDLLFKIYQPPYEAALMEAKGNLAQAEAELDINQLNVDRNRALVPQKLISEQDFQTLQATVKENLGQIEAAKGQVLAAEVNLGYTEIRSPIDGMAGLYNVNIGNVVTAMSGTELTSVERYQPIYSDFIVPVTKFPQLRQEYTKAGGELKIRAAYLSERDKFRYGKLTILGNAVNETTGTVNLRATLENEDAFFWPDQPLAIRIYLKELKDAVLIPSSAVALGQKGEYVFVVNDDNTVKQVYVTPGQLQDDKSIVIEKGLKKGQKVVTKGLLMLRDGVQVSISELDGKKQIASAASAGKTETKPGSSSQSGT